MAKSSPSPPPGAQTAVQLLSPAQLFVTPWTAACQAPLSSTVSRSLLKFVSVESVMPSSHLILCCPRLLLPSIVPSIRVFSNESALYIRWPKYWSFSFSISPSNEYSGLISFKIDCFDLLAVQGIFKSLLKHHSLKASNFWCSAFFMVQLSHRYLTTGTTSLPSAHGADRMREQDRVSLHFLPCSPLLPHPTLALTFILG